MVGRYETKRHLENIRIERRNVKEIEFSGYIYFRLGTIPGTCEHSSQQLFAVKYEVISEKKWVLFLGFL
jgi:hypothetical protein